MVITTAEIVQQTCAGFSTKYPHFKDFQTQVRYAPYWQLCLQALQNRDLLGHIVFCNDIFAIPPVKSFLCAFSAQLVTITGHPDAQLEDFTKKAIGALWGYVFKAVFSYAGQKSVSVSLNKMFMVKTATCYTQPQKQLVLAY